MFALFGLSLSPACDRHREPSPRPRKPVVSASVPAVSAEPAASTPQPVDATPPPAPVPWPKDEHALPAADKGIFSDLDEKVRIRLPDWLAPGPSVVVQVANGRRFVAVDGVVVGWAPDAMPAAFAVGDIGPWDRDGDHIPDSLDILVGAKKTVLNAAAYKSTYRVIPYPNGDMPRTEGVCTDVVVRALRNAGIDLQQAVFDDARVRPSAYPGIRKPDRNIDHRRVRNLLPYFKRYWTSLPPDPRDRSEPWMPGDVVFLDTMNDSQPEHMGIVSDRVSSSGFPLIINNWTDGTRTAEMDLLSFVPVRHRFRVPLGEVRVPRAHAGPNGLLLRRGLALGPHRQLMVVTTPTWDASAGRMQRYQRSGAQDPWRRVGKPVPVTVGARGLGAGRGLHPEGWAMAPETKREGDMRSPAGVFTLGKAFGPEANPPYAPGTWPWKQATGRDRWVDDPASAHYNSWQRVGDAGANWASAEDLSAYRLALVVEHNRAPVRSGAGSAIFVHVWADASAATSGCTAMSRESLVEVLRWLDPSAKPALVQVAGRVFGQRD
ncbi:MAG: DUF1287 domain-containing protein [Myxococcota bacterium]